MKKLEVFIEINGKQTYVGSIMGDSSQDAKFSYAEEYIASHMPPISISLPISDKAFNSEITKNFFEGLLPEGFARKSVANWIHTSEEDYMTILEILGAECLGAIRISDNNDNTGAYEKLSIEDVKALAREGVSKSTEIVTESHLSLTGASGKVGLYYDQEHDVWYKPKGNAPSTHIVKQSHVRLANIVTNEQLSLKTASRLGITIPESFIVNTGEKKDAEVLFATKRYDRFMSDETLKIDGIVRPFRLHQEDFAQALGIPAYEKYEKGEQRYLSKIFGILRNYAANPIEDQIKLWNIIVFDFLVGNTDNHIKNLSLLYSSDLKKINLAPAYDIMSTTIYEGSSREMAIGIGAERNIDNINREHFEKAATEVGLSKKIALKQFDELANGFKKALEETADEMYEDGYQQAKLIKDKILKNGGYLHL